MELKLNVARTTIHLVEEGEGPPVLFLHGNPDSSEVWSGIIPRLSARYRCIAPDLPGFGRSGAPDDFNSSLDGMAAWVDALVTALGIHEPLNLVVHDIGCPFGLAWTVLNPDKVRSVVITNTVFASDYRWHLFGRLCRPPVVGELVQALTSRRGFTRDLLRASRKLRREQIHRTYALITPSVKRMMLRWYRAANPRNFAGCGLRQFMHPIPRHRPGFCHRCLSLQASGSRSSHHSAATAKDRSQGSRWAMSNVPDSNICIISA